MSYPDITTGLAHKLAMSGGKQGLYPVDFNRIAEHRTALADASAISNDLAYVVYKPGVIDCAFKPSTPIHFAVHWHRKMAAFHSSKLSTCLAQIDFNQYQELRNSYYGKLANACVLDYLLTHQGEIPVEWEKIESEGKAIFFFGTEYRRIQNNPDRLPDPVVVRYLAYKDNGWHAGIGPMHGMEFETWMPYTVVYPE